MINRITRRNFLKLAAASTAVTAFAPAVYRKASRIESHVRSPEETLPGEAAWFASTCRQCSAGCGIIVRTVNGRAKKIEGNPDHPLNRGKLCARGQAGLQVLYNPDRLRNAVQQTGGRGSRQFEPLHWEEALEILFEKLQTSNPSKISFFGGQMPDQVFYLVSLWLEAQGAAPPLMFDLHSAFEGRRTAALVSETLFGLPLLPVYDITNADVIFSFGANLLETWESPVAQSIAYGDFRHGKTGGRGFFAQFEPRLSATAASADEWVPLHPGAEGLVALALGRIIVEQGLGKVGTFGQAEAGFYRGLDVNTLSEATSVPVEKLEQLASVLAEADRPVVIPGGYLAGQTNGFNAHLAIHALNLILRRLGQRGGVFLSSPSPADTLPAAPPPDSFEAVQNLIERMKAGEVEVLFIYGANPVFELPGTSGFVEALDQVPFIVSFSSFVDETVVQSDLVLPDHTYLEGWGYQVVSPGADRPVVSSQQPVVRPLYDTRSTVEVILALASEMGGAVAEAIPWTDEVLFMEDASGKLFGSSLSAYGARSAGEFWAAWRQYGGWWSEREFRLEPEPIGFGENILPSNGPSFVGDVIEFPYHLYPYPHLGLSDGRGANLPWLQEMPDPMTTACWQTWVEVNPETAHNLGVENNDVVKIISKSGEIEAVVVEFPGIRPNVVAIPVGQGHSDYGRYAQGRGSNPVDLLAPVIDPQAGTLAWGATRVRVEPTGRTFNLARLESLDGEGRETIR